MDNWINIGDKMKNTFNLVLLTLIISLPFTNAIVGVSAFYWDDNPLIMSPGETKDVQFYLQNTGDREVVLQAELKEGSEIASLIDSNLEYVVPPGSKDVIVNVRVSVEENAKIGDKYVVKGSFRQIKTEKAGMVHLGISIDKSFPVLVKSIEVPTVEEGKPGKFSNYQITTIMLVVILIGYVIYIFIKKKKK